ncbi:MAG: hypothetical protein WBL63_24525 [Candidatus Acidiferrum sp.]
MCVQAVAPQVTVEAGAADVENLRGTKAVAIAYLEDFLDMRFADVVERKPLPVLVAGQAWSAVLEMLGEIAEIDEVSSGCNARGGNNIFELRTFPGQGCWSRMVCARRVKPAIFLP